MNWDTISFDWNQVRAFLATAEEGTFSAAARALKTTQPTIGRQITELETRLGVTLLERSVRGPELTAAGRDLLEHVRAMAEAATLISLAADGQSHSVAGEVTITATDLFSAVSLPPMLAPLRETAPGVRIRLVAANDVRNLIQREADIAIRHVRPQEPELIARYIGDLYAGLYASTSYLDRAGRPRHPSDARAHAFIGPLELPQFIDALVGFGLPVTAENMVFTSDSWVVIWEMLKAGHGISILPHVLCEDVSGLEPVLPDLPPMPFPVWLVTHRELQTSPRIRIVFDALARGLAELVRRRQANTWANT